MNLANQGVEVSAYDWFEPVANFWSCVLKYPGRVAAYVDELYPITKKAFYDLRDKYHRIRSRCRRASVFFALNRSSFNGCAFSGGMTLDRFTKSVIERLREFRVENLRRPSWAHPVVVGGRLYIRNQNKLTVYDVSDANVN